MAGRRPKPPEVHEARGNPGKRPMPTPPARVQGIPDPPARLKGSALTCWKRVADLLHQRHQLTLDSLESLACLAETFAEREKHLKALNKKGWTMKHETTTGVVVEKARPEVSMYQDADRRYRAWLIEFGLTDASRGKVNAVAIRPQPQEGKRKAVEAKADTPGSRYGLN